MDISVLLNVHSNPDLVFDSLDAIRTYMSKDILVVVDKAGWDNFKDINLPAYKMEGFWHNSNRAPFRNITLGLMTIVDQFKSDWYCYIEYDALVTSDEFKEDLKKFDNQGIWLAGNDYRFANYKLPMIENLIGAEFNETQCLLGCCLFFKREFLLRLKEINFFKRFLYLTNAFRDTIPGFNEQGGYDIGEVIYPTLANHLGGKVHEFARFNDFGSAGWSGDSERYPMRFRPEIHEEIEEFPDASIIHPIKKLDHPIRLFHREKRKLRNTKYVSV